MVTALSIYARNFDGSVGVHFDTKIRHGRGLSQGEVFGRAIVRMVAFLRRNNPEVLASLHSFEVEQDD